jgi:predicted CXXCH cytochrome family protein
MKKTAREKIHRVLVLVQATLVIFIIAFAAHAAQNPPDPSEKIEAGTQADEHAQVPASGDEYQEGPHAKLACTGCHKENPGQHQPSEESVNSDSIGLCQSCHPVEHLHPLGLALQQPVGKENLDLPLGKGILQGKIVCPTCHDIHQQANSFHLLRGQNLTYGDARNSLCSSCHQDHFLGESPHTDEASRCGFCHVVKPGEKEPLAVQPDTLMLASCSLCHPNLSSAHYENVNPFLDEVIRQQAAQVGNFFIDGGEVCTSCHDPHRENNGRYMLRGDYVELSKDSRSLDPHWKDFLCLSCHSGKPEKSNAQLREDGDRNKLCNRCHGSEYARPDIHPVGIIPSQHIRVPAGMPLQNGKLSCETCHNTLLQMGRPKKYNPSDKNSHFLRRNQISRLSFCFLCHTEETYKRLNPHNQLNAQGEIQEETCLFCHASIPDVNFIGPEKVSFKVYNPDEYCIGCHHGFTVNHPAGVHHLVKPPAKILAAIQTSVQRIGVELPLFKGLIVCATCHNPHQAGVIKIAAAATGTKRENKLRLKPGRRQCTGCHWDK